MDKMKLELDKLAVELDKNSKRQYEKLLKMLKEGVKPQEALSVIYLSFEKNTYNYDFIVALSTAFTALLEKPFTVKELLEYKVGKVKLSDKLYVDAKKVATEAKTIIEEHLAGFHNLRKLALSLYAGYDQRPESKEVIKVTKVLPRYLKDAVKPFASEVDTEIARLTASGLKTPALRTAYLKYLDKAELGIGQDTLTNSLKTAVAEKLRYISNRLAQTTAAKAYNVKVATDLLARDDVQYVRYALSGSHSVTDICDHFKGVDLFGVGGGIYPKGEAPLLPAHPFCRCRLIAVVNLRTPTTPEARPEATRDFYDSLSDEEKALVYAGGLRKHVENDGDVLEYINRSKPDEYKIRLLKDL